MPSASPAFQLYRLLPPPPVSVSLPPPSPPFSPYAVGGHEDERDEQQHPDSDKDAREQELGGRVLSWESRPNKKETQRGRKRRGGGGGDGEVEVGGAGGGTVRGELIAGITTREDGAQRRGRAKRRNERFFFPFLEHFKVLNTRTLTSRQGRSQ